MENIQGFIPIAALGASGILFYDFLIWALRAKTKTREALFLVSATICSIIVIYSISMIVTNNMIGYIHHITKVVFVIIEILFGIIGGLMTLLIYSRD